MMTKDKADCFAAAKVQENAIMKIQILLSVQKNDLYQRRMKSNDSGPHSSRVTLMEVSNNFYYVGRRHDYMQAMKRWLL